MSDDDVTPARLRAAWAYALEQLGYAVTEETQESFSAEERERWDEVVQEYLDATSEGDGEGDGTG